MVFVKQKPTVPLRKTQISDKFAGKITCKKYDKFCKI